ncbi:MAG TPA: WbqC family protein [Flavipsychrobacter sp.]|nr:WbqC family protein [Flavipsychrobacter sp.]
MSFVISSLNPFPNIVWWCQVLQTEKVVFDVNEHFEKMTYRNRYHIAGANGLLKMSIPIQGGREHKSAMGNTRIANQDKWQQQHWRTLISAYSNAPYFEFYCSALEELFIRKFEWLADFNLATIHWLKQQLQISFEEQNTNAFQKQYPDATCDLRNSKSETQRSPSIIHTSTFQLSNLPTVQLYQQVFQERTGFLPNLSLLDLLFAEGPYALKWLRENSKRLLV